MIVALIYGGLFWGIFPIKPEISWESHLWGGVAGLGLALLYRKSAPIIPQAEDDDDMEEIPEEEPQRETELEEPQENH